MSKGRIERIREYRNPRHPEHVHGQSSERATLDDWSSWASHNSRQGTRASDGEIELPDTGKCKLHSTSAAPRKNRAADAAVGGGRVFMSRHLVR